MCVCAVAGVAGGIHAEATASALTLLSLPPPVLCDIVQRLGRLDSQTLMRTSRSLRTTLLAHMTALKVHVYAVCREWQVREFVEVVNRAEPLRLVMNNHHVLSRFNGCGLPVTLAQPRTARGSSSATVGDGLGDGIITVAPGSAVRHLVVKVGIAPVRGGH